MTLSWLKDTAERVLRTWLQAFLGIVIAGGFDVPGVVDMSVVRKAAIAALAAALSALMSAVGGKVGDPDSGSLLPRRKPAAIEAVAAAPAPAADAVLTALDQVTLGKLTANAQRRHQTVEDDAARIITAYFK